MSLESFMQEFENLTESNPLASFERIYEGDAGATSGSEFLRLASDFC
jgi:hypothetical protein